MVCPKCGYQAKSADDPLLAKSFNSIDEWLAGPDNTHSSGGDFFLKCLDEASKEMKQPVNDFFEGIDYRFEVLPPSIQMTQAKLSVSYMKDSFRSVNETVYHSDSRKYGPSVIKLRSNRRNPVLQGWAKTGANQGHGRGAWQAAPIPD